MTFDDNKPIARQIVEYCWLQILSGKWAPESRIPSTKDLAVNLGVNPRTVMKAYDELAEEEIIFQRRGMGYYTNADAPARIMEKRRNNFVNETVPAFRKLMEELRFTPEEILELLKNR